MRVNVCDGVAGQSPEAPPVYPFELIDAAAMDRMEWDGPLSDVMQGLGQMALTQSVEGGYWHPFRLMATVMHRSVEGEDKLRLVQSAADLSVDVFAGQADQGQVGDVSRLLVKHGLYDLNIRQSYSGINRYLNDPSLSRQSADRLATKVGDPVLMMPVCNGGFIAGVQAFLHYRRLQSDNVLYPVRFSTSKSNDAVPHLNDAELEYITEASADRPIVIFDEDACSGETIDALARHLRARMPKRDILGLVNQDYRNRFNKADQGEWWGRHDKLALRPAIRRVRRLL